MAEIEITGDHLDGLDTANRPEPLRVTTEAFELSAELSTPQRKTVKPPL
jgi:hypothetical protein